MAYQPSASIEKFFTGLSCAEPMHYDRIPAILDHLTYLKEQVNKDTGETEYFRCRLTPAEKDFYRILKQRGGMQNKAWATIDDYAAMMGVERKAIIRYKKTLQMPFEQMEGNSLITIEESYRSAEKDGHQFKKPIHTIIVNNDWRYNNAFMATWDKTYQAPKTKISKNEYERALEKMRQPGLSEIVHNLGSESQKGTDPHNLDPKKGLRSPGARSQNGTVNRLHSSNTSVYSNNTAGAASVENPKGNVKGCSVEEWLGSLFDLKTCMRILSEYSETAVELTRRYLYKRMEKKPLKNPSGYVLKILQNQWYLQQE